MNGNPFLIPASVPLALPNVLIIFLIFITSAWYRRASVLRRNTCQNENFVLAFTILLTIEQIGISSLFKTRNTRQLLTFAALNLDKG